MRSSIYTMGKQDGLREGEAKGLREGEAKGLREGEAKGLREAIEVLCEVLGVRLTPRRREVLAALDAPGLSALLAGLRAERSWPR